MFDIRSPRRVTADWDYLSHYSVRRPGTRIVACDPGVAAELVLLRVCGVPLASQPRLVRSPAWGDG